MSNNYKILACLFCLIIGMIFTFSTINAQDVFEEWQKQQQEEMQKFKDEQDREFMDFLEKEWKEFQLFQGLVADKTPKPIKAPMADSITHKQFPDTNIIKDITIPKSTPLPRVIDIPRGKKEVELKDTLIPPDAMIGKLLHFTFYDLPLSISYDESLEEIVSTDISEKTIASFWETISNPEYESCFEQAQNYKEQMRLNDWGYCILLYEIGKVIFQDSKNYANLFIWFMLTKSGYEARVGYNEKEVYLLLPSEQIFYNLPYFTSENKKIYVIPFDSKITNLGSLFTYDGNYPGADKLINLMISKSPNIKDNIIKKEFKFSYRDKEFTINGKYNKYTVDFFKKYPHTNYEVYFNAPLSPVAYSSLITELKPILQGKSEAEAVNILLRFIQTAFDYKTDDEQFGMEKCLFSDETIFYPYSDCEDRSVFFAYLVKKILGLEVIGLDYPGHVATAIKFHTDIDGDYIVFQENKYIVCDPTYINANVGMCMPEFKKIMPEIIQLQ